ncbi:3-beta hydroxysteroid dehydrogenase [Nocardioides szechwanensis]|uniref:Male sterility protein n=1 Tax=Nocardioides szechwanensis TaxID=1005944 RepID=A0A1G9XJ80_9ACTN|nr:SDR family oxidoreductase [Nocardioides szechwanensis]GEP32295.1 3-beta hydroxysteroid dehydrogenase [Nocardioides szechwanensis]SDM96814.1 Male sterility protein [Nocardioides szechwanensis]
MTVLMTGFPGFLGSALLPRLLARREHVRAVCLVQPEHRALAETRVLELENDHPHLRGRIDLVDGDITAPDLGIDPAELAGLDGVTEVWHLAAVYDLAVDPELARRVNVDGTQQVLDFCRSRAHLGRLHYVSTCYVSGRYEGTFTEDGLDEDQEFRNHYESTKYDAEVLVRAAMAEGLPATIYRPGIVVGDSETGETQKYDGPYFLAEFLRRQLSVAVVPAVGAADEVKVCLVPRDFVVDAMDQLSVLPASLGKTYALTDPNPPTVRRLVETFAHHLGKRVLWVRLPLGLTRAAVGSVPGMERLLGLPAEALDYFASPTTYSTTNTTTDLAGTGVACPSFDAYAGTLLDFMGAHPEYDSKAMV